MKTTVVIVFFLISCFLFAGFIQDDFAGMVNKELSHSVPVIYSNDLKEWQEKQTGFLLLDAREYAEYKVSHINNSTWIGENISRYTFREKNKKIMIVVYCSIGYRSEKVSEKLNSYGYKNVFNLWGGVFDWINKGFPVVDMAGNNTDAIHPYSEKWGKWLTRGVKKYE